MCKIYTKCIQKFVKMWDTFCVYTFCIHQSWSTKRAHHKNYVYNLYTTLMQNLSANNCMEKESHVSTYFDRLLCNSWIVNQCTQLRFENCWLSTGGKYQINGIMYYILHYITSNQFEQIQIPMHIWKKTCQFYVAS